MPSGSEFTRSAKYSTEAVLAGRKLMITISICWLIWVMPAPIRPGPMRLNRVRTSALSRRRGQCSTSPARRTAHNSNTSWNTPDRLTPSASAWPTVGSRWRRPSMQPMETRLNTTGAAAAAAKRFMPFSTPDHKAVRQISGI